MQLWQIPSNFVQIFWLPFGPCYTSYARQYLEFFSLINFASLWIHTCVYLVHVQLVWISSSCTLFFTKSFRVIEGISVENALKNPQLFQIFQLLKSCSKYVLSQNSWKTSIYIEVTGKIHSVYFHEEIYFSNFINVSLWAQISRRTALTDWCDSVHNVSVLRAIDAKWDRTS